MLPSLDNRRKILNMIENVNDVIKLYGDKKTEIEKPFMDRFFNRLSNSWIIDEFANMLDELKSKSFFCRFKISVLINLIPRMKVCSYKANEVIFVEEKIFVILNGHVALRNHAAN